jgi:hypothetical protein
MTMQRAEIEEFLHRDWRSVEALKRSFWTARKKEEGVWDVFAAVAAFRDQIRTQRPDWPTPAQREEDLLAHLKLGKALRSVHASAPR